MPSEQPSWLLKLHPADVTVTGLLALVVIVAGVRLPFVGWPLAELQSSIYNLLFLLGLFPLEDDDVLPGQVILVHDLDRH